MGVCVLSDIPRGEIRTTSGRPPAWPQGIQSALNSEAGSLGSPQVEGGNKRRLPFGCPVLPPLSRCVTMASYLTTLNTSLHTTLVVGRTTVSNHRELVPWVCKGPARGARDSHVGLPTLRKSL